MAPRTGYRTSVNAPTDHSIAPTDQDRSDTSQTGGSPAVRAEALTKAFDADPVVIDLDFEITDGSIVGLIGPSGCGKTTTVRLLAGLLAPTSGTAEVHGTTSTELSASQRSNIGYLPQAPALFPDLSLLENLHFHASMYGMPFRRKGHLRTLLDWVELDDDRGKRVSEVSGGMKRRLALAAAFVHAPRLVFLDEPTAGIDPILRDKFWQEFRMLGDDGRTLVVTTQYMGEAAYCDYVGLLSDGELLMLDTPDNLRRAAFDGEVIDITLTRPASDAELAQISALPIVVGSAERISHDVVRIVVDDAGRALADLSAPMERIGLEVEEAAEHIVNYDEAFVRVVERHRELRNSGDDRTGTD
ncbi:MAG: ABC transporter ATP-binding protein [Ilumatobacter sp.]|nr:MAG: ABC transporter ATP-binding protein [Ilumatobacter sp.]